MPPLPRGCRDGTRRGAGAAGAALVLGMIATAPHALAGAPGSAALVPGGFPLPEFHLNFPDRLAEPLRHRLASDLRISLTSPDKSVLQFLFSPRPQFAIATDRGTGTSRSSAGLSWNLFDSNGFFGSFGLAGSVTRTGGVDDVYRRYLGPPLALHRHVRVRLSTRRPAQPDAVARPCRRARSHSATIATSTISSLRYGLKF